MAIVSAVKSQRAGIQKALYATWKHQMPIYEAQQKFMLYPLPWVNIRKATYVFKDAMPVPLPWWYGSGRTEQGIVDRELACTVYPYEMTIPYSGWDKEDDQLGDLKEHVASGVKNFMKLPDLLFTEYLTGVPSYNWAIVNAYDGVNLYSAVNGDGDDRFGVTGGNILTGSGAATKAQIVSDIKAVKRRFLEMLIPTINQAIHDPDTISYNKMHWVIPPALEPLFEDIANLERIYTDVAINTAQDNYLKGKIQYHVNQKLSNNVDYFAVLEHELWRPFAYRAPQDVRTLWAELSNSDNAREFNEEKMHADMRLGISPYAPWVTIKVNN